MVNVKFTDKRGKTWIAKFPKRVTLKDVKRTAKKINPKITKIEYYRKKRRR